MPWVNQSEPVAKVLIALDFPGILIVIPIEEATRTGAMRREEPRDSIVETSIAGVAALAWGVILGAIFRRPRRTGQRDNYNCGYKLMGNVSGVCPECGTSVKGDSSLR